MRIITFVSFLLLVYGCVAPPVTEKKKEEGKEEGNDVDQQVFDVEYKRYLQEVVQVLESDDDFKQRLVKADPEDIKTGKISKELEFVNHNVRSKLDELKRQELERLRHIAIQQYEENNGIDKKHMKIPLHVDSKNMHTFEAEDLRKLIVQTTRELETADRKRKDEFKEYEMQKELQYQEQLKHLDEKNRSDAQKQHEQMEQKHKQHPSLHHPGSKQQFEQVWEEQDHLSPENFNPKTFFHLHDLDGNGVWDANEVKALFRKELDKMYDPNAPEDDIRERFEEMERMREHVFNETDTNKDQLISYQEFLDQTKKQEFERDEGWEPLDQRQAYTDDEYKNYANQHEEEIRRMIDQGLIPPAPPGYAPMIIPPGHPQQYQQGVHPQPGYHVPPPGVHPNAIPHGYQPQGQFGQHPQQQNYQGQHLPNRVPQGQPQPPGYYNNAGVPQQQEQYHPNAGVPSPQHQQQQYHPNAGVPPQQQQQQYHRNAEVPPPQQHHTNAGASHPQEQQYHPNAGVPSNSIQHPQQGASERQAAANNAINAPAASNIPNHPVAGDSHQSQNELNSVIPNHASDGSAAVPSSGQNQQQH